MTYLIFVAAETKKDTDYYLLVRYFIPWLEEYSQSAIRSLESRCVFCGTPRVAVEYIVFHESFPALITASKVSRRTPDSVRRHLLFSSVWILRMQNQISLSNSTFSSLNLRKSPTLKAEYFIQKSWNLRNNNRNPGTVEKSFDWKDLWHVCSKQMLWSKNSQWPTAIIKPRLNSFGNQW